jgi:predicted nucleic acid-binding protein
MSRGYLLDTNVLSATAPDRRDVRDAAKQAARQWIKEHEGRLWLPVLAIGEIAAGVGEREAAGATRHAAQLSAWLRGVLLAYPERILNYGIAEALCCRQMACTARRNGIQIGFADMSVACIAVTNDLVVATRNTKHFTPLGTDVVNPFAHET